MSTYLSNKILATISKKESKGIIFRSPGWGIVMSFVDWKCFHVTFAGNQKLSLQYKSDIDLSTVSSPISQLSKTQVNTKKVSLTAQR